jgi:dipeptidyl aminopeptidase/acylaminoacyl peptidase
MEKTQYRTGDSLLLCGFGERTKENGFLRQVLGHRGQPEVLGLEDCLYYQTTTQKPDGQPFDHGMRPVKASGVNCWVVKRQTARESPNFYVTQDLRHYRAVSDERPELRYKWLKAELVNYKQLDGRPGQGILYKPEDFDEKKKYPVLFYYYEQLTHRLHEFPPPGYTENDINIPWFVGHGYLVFTPDIHFEVGAKSGKTAGWWAYNAVESAAKYLSGLRYVDERRMGLQGHSFGGFETNYIVTHSHRFGAAAEFSGMSDMISWYLSLTGGAGEDNLDFLQSMEEMGIVRNGATLWERRDLYEDASAVLWADQVNTPLLLVHNKKDGVVPWRQGVEWYLALRRLRKPSWMLQYDESNHSNADRDARDYTLRLTQFFGYYLKGEPPPRWMTEGIPARLKGIDSGLELDTIGRRP